MFSNVDEHARRLPSPASEAARHGSSRKSARGVFSGGRHLGLPKAGRIDVPRWERAHAIGVEGASASWDAIAERGARGFDSTEPSPADKAATLPPHPCHWHRVIVDRPEAGSAPSSARLLEAG
jgi:hypothetical protein